MQKDPPLCPSCLGKKGGRGNKKQETLEKPLTEPLEKGTKVAENPVPPKGPGPVPNIQGPPDPTPLSVALSAAPLPDPHADDGTRHWLPLPLMVLALALIGLLVFVCMFGEAIERLGKKYLGGDQDGGAAANNQ